MAHVKGHKDIYKGRKIPPRKKTAWEIAKEIAKETAGTFAGKGTEKGKVDRGTQFANYLATIDRLSFQNYRIRRGRVAEGPLTARAGSTGTAKVTKMDTIMDRYHDKALRLAQAKYYQKQVG